MTTRWRPWAVTVGLLACAGPGSRPVPATESSVTIDAAAAAAHAAAAAPDAAPAVDASPLSDAELRRQRMRTPRGAQVVAEELQRLAESRARFDALAAAHADSYVYTSGLGSWTSADAVTTVVVVRGVVVERRYEAHRDDGARRTRLAAWTERGRAVGRHTDAGDPPRSLPQHYDACAALITSTAAAEGLVVWVDFDERGLLAHCAREFEVCSDPCWEGIGVRSVTFGP